MGKSWKAINDMEFNLGEDPYFNDITGLYIKNSSNKWWDGYY